jgi:hypothetical protein
MMLWILLIFAILYILRNTKNERYVNIRDEKDGKYYKVKLDNQNNFIEKIEVKMREDYV